MGSDIVVEFKPDSQEPPRRGRDILWGIVGALLLILAIVVFLELFPFLLVVLAVAALLAALSTWKTYRRRKALAMSFERAAKPVGVRTYFVFLAAWFVALLAVVPLFVMGVVVGVAALVIVGLVALVLLIAALFNIN